MRLCPPCRQRGLRCRALHSKCRLSRHFVPAHLPWPSPSRPPITVTSHHRPGATTRSTPGSHSADVVVLSVCVAYHHHAPIGALGWRHLHKGARREMDGCRWGGCAGPSASQPLGSEECPPCALSCAGGEGLPLRGSPSENRRRRLPPPPTARSSAGRAAVLSQTSLALAPLFGAPGGAWALPAVAAGSGRAAGRRPRRAAVFAGRSEAGGWLHPAKWPLLPPMRE